MYKKGFYIEKEVGNNAFSFEKRDNNRLYVPSIINIDNFNKIELQDNKDKVTFEDFGFDDKLSTNYGLRNFYKIYPHLTSPLTGGRITAPIYLFDNHNHALYFWYEGRDKGLIGDGNTLIHIDEHADMRDPGKYLLKSESYDLEKVFDYTNFSKVNVGNYIIPAQKEGIIGNIIQIRNTSNLEDYLENKDNYKNNIILNLDLDFFQPDLDFIDYELKKKVILDAAKKASVITVATSPFFIDQELAINVFKDLFD